MIPDEAVEAKSSPHYVPIEWNNATLSWNAICGDCKELLFMLTDEAVRNGPWRDSGRSALLPMTMSIHHECWGRGAACLSPRPAALSVLTTPYGPQHKPSPPGAART